MIASSNIF